MQDGIEDFIFHNVDSAWICICITN